MLKFNLGIYRKILQTSWAVLKLNKLKKKRKSEGQKYETFLNHFPVELSAVLSDFNIAINVNILKNVHTESSLNLHCPVSYEFRNKLQQLPFEMDSLAALNATWLCFISLVAEIVRSFAHWERIVNARTTECCVLQHHHHYYNAYYGYR